MSRVWRSHRFTALAQLADPNAWAGPGAVPSQVTSAMHDGYQRGMERGYREGHEAGMRSGMDTGRGEGREEGRQQGLEAGKQEALARFERLAGPVNEIVEALKQMQADYQTAMRKEVIELVAKVARQVIRKEIQMAPTQLLALVDEALSTMPRVADNEVVVYLNPEDLERIIELEPTQAERWNLWADDKLEPGECRVKAGNREADAGCSQRLAACMEQIEEQLLPHQDEQVAA
ncbi:flagellar assembly protein FliH [Steroidobacter agaridevorans]|uniref:Flagellar assembly protein FliH n=1 Tax=Steroidobacter agaridevorans TaxID=2695856 RepID=A0A829YLZ7_9GAMM|nr:flagellar assembly protein FliH [Steroidobacter agaridevorans]GFE84397.1 flagellar assembly protein FliH [Steroidobacter agaridevorans]GFE87217.1 flagellar assembly protein FliH [Steroidobacter agaridevorans]